MSADAPAAKPAGTWSWLPYAVDILKIAGPLTILLAAAMYWMTQVADRDHQRMIQASENVTKVVTAVSGQMTSLSDSTGRANSELLNLVRVMCLNQATDVLARRDCVLPERAIARAIANNVP